jgi:hypothetical protein
MVRPPQVPDETQIAAAPSEARFETIILSRGAPAVGSSVTKGIDRAHTCSSPTSVGCSTRYKFSSKLIIKPREMKGVTISLTNGDGVSVRVFREIWVLGNSLMSVGGGTRDIASSSGAKSYRSYKLLAHQATKRRDCRQMRWNNVSPNARKLMREVIRHRRNGGF